MKSGYWLTRRNYISYGLNETKIAALQMRILKLRIYALNRKDGNCFGFGVAICVHKSIRFNVCVDLTLFGLGGRGKMAPEGFC